VELRFGQLAAGRDRARRQNDRMVIANFKQVVKDGTLRFASIDHPLVDAETLKKMGAERVATGG